MYPFYTYYSPLNDTIPDYVFHRQHRGPEFGGIEDFYRRNFFQPGFIERRKPSIDDHLRLSPSLVSHRLRSTSAENFTSPQIPVGLVRRLTPKHGNENSSDSAVKLQDKNEEPIGIVRNLLRNDGSDSRNPFYESAQKNFRNEDHSQAGTIPIQSMKQQQQQDEVRNSRKLNKTNSNSDIMHKRISAEYYIHATPSVPIPQKSSDQMLRDRLKLYGLKEKTKIKGDGNCQFASCADQFFDDPDKCTEVRQAVVEWLKKNQHYRLPNGTTIGDYLQTEFFPTWNDYVHYMSQDKIWGDHFTLLAIAEVYQTKIVIVSSMDVDPGIDPFTVIVPQKWTKTIYISHLHELHYSSLCPDDEE